MAKKAKAKKKARTAAQRSAAAKASWALRRMKASNAPTATEQGPWTTPRSLVMADTLLQLKASNAPTPTQNGQDISHGGMLVGLSAGYEALALELNEAYVQSSLGKGKERHANSRPFDRQPILELGRLYGPGFAAGQAAKKVQEALSMQSKGKFTKEQALAEVHGGIVYLAALASLIREG